MTGVLDTTCVRPPGGPTTPSSLTLHLLPFKLETSLATLSSVKKNITLPSKAQKNPKKKHPWESLVVYLGGPRAPPALQLPPRRCPSCCPSSMPLPATPLMNAGPVRPPAPICWLRHLPGDCTQPKCSPQSSPVYCCPHFCLATGPHRRAAPAPM